MTDLAEAITSEFGGASGFAKEFKKVYDAGNHQLKAQLMRAAVKVVADNTAMGGATEQFSQLSERDLQLRLIELLNPVIEP